MYFNIDERMQGLLVWTAFYFTLAMLSLRAIATLILEGNCRLSFLLLFLAGLYPAQYGFWCLWNYWNESFFPMLHTQLFFTGTELIVTLIVVAFCDKRNPVLPAGLWAIISICAMHATQNRLDQSRPAAGVALMLYADVLYCATAGWHLFLLVRSGERVLSLQSLLQHPQEAMAWMEAAAGGGGQHAAEAAGKGAVELAAVKAPAMEGSAAVTANSMALQISIPSTKSANDFSSGSDLPPADSATASGSTINTFRSRGGLTPVNASIASGSAAASLGSEAPGAEVAAMETVAPAAVTKPQLAAPYTCKAALEHAAKAAAGMVVLLMIVQRL